MNENHNEIMSKDIINQKQHGQDKKKNFDKAMISILDNKYKNKASFEELPQSRGQNYGLNDSFDEEQNYDEDDYKNMMASQNPAGPPSGILHKNSAKHLNTM